MLATVYAVVLIESENENTSLVGVKYLFVLRIPKCSLISISSISLKHSNTRRKWNYLQIVHKCDFVWVDSSIGSMTLRSSESDIIIVNIFLLFAISCRPREKPLGINCTASQIDGDNNNCCFHFVFRILFFFFIASLCDCGAVHASLSCMQ